MDAIPSYKYLQPRSNAAAGAGVVEGRPRAPERDCCPMLGPIFAREALTLPRRTRHYLARGLFLGGLWILILTVWQTLIGWERPATLGDQARFGLLAFRILTNVQLVLVLFFAALSAASAVSLEKDRRTFLLLLLTDLRDHEIVLGKLLGSLLQIVVLIAGTFPMLALLMFLGGVDMHQALEALLLLATTTLAAGSLGNLVALWRDRTFQSLALTVLFLVLYLCVVQGLAILPVWFPSLDAAAVREWQVRLQPFLALQQVLDPPLRPGQLASPAVQFSLVMLGWTLLLNGWALWRLRVWNPSGEPIMQRETPGADALPQKDWSQVHAAPGRVREVRGNPILWREVRTRAYGRRPLLVKTAYFLVLALVSWYALGSDARREWGAADGLLPIAVLSLILLGAQAVTAITSERDLGALDLLLVTDVSPKEFVFGKMLGILFNAKEYVLPPLILAGVYAWRGQLASPPEGGRNLEAFLAIALGTVLVMAFVLVLGIHVGLRTPNSRLAVIHTLGTVFFLTVGTLVCIYLILINGRFEYQWLSFAGFLFTGVAGLWWVLSGDKPSGALTTAAFLCPIAVFYAVTNVLIGKPGRLESTDPLVPFLVVGGAFGFTLAAMLVPLLSEFDVAVGKSAATGD